MEKQHLSIFNFSIFISKIATILLVFGLIFSYIFEKTIIFNSEINGASKVNKILTITSKNEIPIFGSSRAEGNFVPSLLSVSTCHNYGLAGAQANIWLFFLQQELMKKKSTPIIINLDLAGLVFSDGAIGNYVPHWHETKAILKSKGELYYNIPFIKYFGHYELYVKNYLNEKLNFTKITDNGGSFDKNVLTPTKFGNLVKQRESSQTQFKLDPSLLSKLNSLIKITSRQLIFVVSPYHSSYFKQFKNIAEVNIFLNTLKTLENVSVIDLRSFITNDKLFLNTSHLNYEGAKHFTSHLNKILKELKLI